MEASVDIIHQTSKLSTEIRKSDIKTMKSMKKKVKNPRILPHLKKNALLFKENMAIKFKKLKISTQNDTHHECVEKILIDAHLDLKNIENDISSYRKINLIIKQDNRMRKIKTIFNSNANKKTGVIEKEMHARLKSNIEMCEVQSKNIKDVIKVIKRVEKDYKKKRRTN